MRQAEILVFVLCLFLAKPHLLAAAGCLSIGRDGDRLHFGRAEDSYCVFLATCLGKKCPIVGKSNTYQGILDLDADGPLGLDGMDRAELCQYVMNASCASAYTAAKGDCGSASDLARRIWYSEQRGICVKCQRYTAAYRKLRDDVCPGLEALQEVASSFVTLDFDGSLARWTEAVPDSHSGITAEL